MNAVIEYLSSYLRRSVQDGILPYYHVGDFKGLKKETRFFQNDRGDHVASFHYSSGEPSKGNVLFCPGMGPGHEAYLREIELLARTGFAVYTLDYTGTGDSEGKDMLSFHQPALDALSAMKAWGLNEKDVSLIGHSLGGFTVANLLAYSPSFPRGIILSGLFDFDLVAAKFGEGKEEVAAYENEHSGVLRGLDLKRGIGEIDRPVLWIHSTDDPIVPFEKSAAIAAENNANPHFELISMPKRGHNPNYTDEAADYLADLVSGYLRLISENKLANKEDRVAYWAKEDIEKMTEQDPVIWKRIFTFLEK